MYTGPGDNVVNQPRYSNSGAPRDSSSNSSGGASPGSSSSSLMALINQIMGGSGGTLPPAKTSGDTFATWLQNLFSGVGANTPPPAPGGDSSNILAQLMANSGKTSAPNSPLGAVVQNPLPSGGFDPFTYGQTGGEATFYHTTPDAKFAPIASMPGLGAPAPNTSVTSKKKKRDDDD